MIIPTTNIVFNCKNCGHRLTNALFQTEEVLTSSNVKYLKDEDSYIQKGGYCQKQSVDGLIHYYIHINDALNLNNHSDQRRFSGCCGISSYDNLCNKICGHCKEELAEIYTDCLGPNYIRLLGEAVTLCEDRTGFYTVLTHDFIQEKLKHEWPEIESLYRFSENKLVAVELMIDLLSAHKDIPEVLSTWLWQQL